MANSHLKDYQWTRIYQQLQGISFIYTNNEAACRRFLEGVLWLARTGAQWRELPARFGRWNSVYKRLTPLHKLATEAQSLSIALKPTGENFPAC